MTLATRRTVTRIGWYIRYRAPMFYPIILLQPLPQPPPHHRTTADVDHTSGTSLYREDGVHRCFSFAFYARSTPGPVRPRLRTMNAVSTR